MKPMSSVESQHPISSPAVKDIKVRINTLHTIQMINTRSYSKMIFFVFSGGPTKSGNIRFKPYSSK